MTSQNENDGYSCVNLYRDPVDRLGFPVIDSNKPKDVLCLAGM